MGDYKNPNGPFINTGKHNISFGDFLGYCNVNTQGLGNLVGMCILNDGSKTIKCKTSNSINGGYIVSGTCDDNIVLMEP